MKTIRSFFGLLVIAGLLSGCGSVLSKEALRSVDYNVDYAQIKADPQAYVGTTIILGGMILDNRINNEGTTLEILKYTLDNQDRPENPDEAMGRFLAKSTRLLDPSIFKSGKLVTMTGTLIGTEVRPLQKASYRYPVFAIQELHLFQNTYYYYPYYPYYPYYYDPFYWRYPYWGRYPYWW
jgi:outer membrane lipoprotein